MVIYRAMHEHSDYSLDNYLVESIIHATTREKAENALYEYLTSKIHLSYENKEKLKHLISICKKKSKVMINRFDFYWIEEVEVI